jgi:hypothetical protein
MIFYLAYRPAADGRSCPWVTEEPCQALGVLIGLALQPGANRRETGRQCDLKEPGNAMDCLVRVLGHVLVHDLEGPDRMGAESLPPSRLALFGEPDQAADRRAIELRRPGWRFAGWPSGGQARRRATASTK